jgi:hypothetical protein
MTIPWFIVPIIFLAVYGVFKRRARAHVFVEVLE